MQRAGGHVDPRGGEVRRRARAALLLPPGASGRRRVPHVPRRGREGAEARARRARRRWPRGRSCTCTRRRRSRRARACSRCCSSTIRSTARSAIRPASASCRTTRSRKDARRTRVPRAQALQSGRGFRRRRACTSPNRCILCTRCVRFMDDVAHDPVLNVSERGDRAVIGKFEGQDLTHPWAANVIDLCPVGALLSKDFLNKARAWELDRTRVGLPELLAGLQHRSSRRATTWSCACVRAPNADVNQYFMCDHGRLDYRWMNRQRSRSTCRWCATARRSPASTGRSRSPRRRTMLRGKRASCARVAQCSRTKRSSCSRVVATARAAPGAFRVAQGDEAPLPGVKDLVAPRRSRGERARRRAARLHDAATRRSTSCAPATCSSSPTKSSPAPTRRRSRTAGAIIVIGTTLPAWARARRRRRAADRELSPRRRARSRISAAACSGSCRRRPRPAFARPSWLRCSAISSRQLGEPTNYFARERRVRARSPRRIPSSPGMSYDTLGLQGTAHARCSTRRRSGTMMLALIAAMLADQVVYTQSTIRSRPSAAVPWLLFTIVKMLIVFTVLHGRRRDADAGRAQDLGVDSGSSSARIASGYGGLLQPAADGVKNIMKEETYPDAAYMPLFILAPMLSFIPALHHVGGDSVRRAVRHAQWGSIEMVAAPMCRSAFCTFSRSRRSACTASCSRAGRRTTSTRCSADFARARR